MTVRLTEDCHWQNQENVYEQELAHILVKDTRLIRMQLYLKVP